MELLNITNGEYFNKYFLSKFGGTAVPFCEVMMDGKAVTDIFSQQFVTLRAKAVGATEDVYREKMYVQDALNGKEYDAICLWFGKDTFCQMNLLTVFAYLEQIEYRGELKLNYIDDETFEVVEADIDVKLGIYRKMYEDILIRKRIPADVGVLSKKAVDLYFDYHSDDGALVKFVKANAQKDKRELIRLLLEQSKDYGLSDLQAEKLVNSVL